MHTHDTHRAPAQRPSTRTWCSLTVAFQPLWGPPLVAHLDRIETTRDDDILVRVRVTPQVFAQLVGTESFGLMAEAFLVGRPQQLDPGRDVTLALRLRRGVHALLGQLGAPHMLIGQAFSVEGHRLRCVLAQTEAWLACSALQPLDDDDGASCEVGIRTLWGRSPR